VLQICDNKQHLGAVFELGKEVIGFDTVEECIELCRYYLAHDEERRIIAANGWKRAMSDYNEVAVFRRLVDVVSQCMVATPAAPGISNISAQQLKATLWPRAWHQFKFETGNMLRQFLGPLKRLVRRTLAHFRA
jgi:hypothetical protein